MKNKGLIVAFSCACIFVVALIATIVVLASGNQNVGTNVSLIYVASDIAGSVSGTYQVGNNPAKDMTTSSGAKVVSFSADTPESLSLLSPNETINMLYGEDVILTYTFTSTGEEYYAHMSYSDTDTPYTNLVFNYKKESDSSYATNASKVVTVPRLGSTTFSVKISIENPYLNASLNGTIDWALTKEKPILVEEQVNLNIANNTGSIIDNDTFSYQTRTVDGKKQFKIVGATPIIDSTSTSGYLNGYYDRTTLASTGKVSSIDDLTNNNGAEFFYFCTNPAVVGSTGYNDPGEIYYTSTSDTDLESWYDIPTSETQLYACFMVPNYTTEELYTGSDTQIIISNNVINIPFKAFYSKSSITDVVFPQSVENIGYGTSNTTSGAFYGCSKLKKIFIPGSVTSIGDYTFYFCRGLNSVTIATGVESIGRYAFQQSENFTSITIPDSVTSIGLRAFCECNGLTSITVLDGNSVYYSSGDCIIRKSDNALIFGCKTSIIPNDVKSIEAFAFYYCSGLSGELIIPNSVTNIGQNAFASCKGLTSLMIPDSVTTLDYSAFVSCSGLTSLTIGSGIRTLAYNAFRACSGLTSIIIPDSITSIGNGTFSYCSGLTSITIPESVTSIQNSAFEGCSGLTSITIGSGVTSIGNQAFYSCSGLTSITVSTSNTAYYSSGNCLIKQSDNSLILGCNTSVIPSGVAKINGSAFYNCRDLTSITIPDSVTSIGDYAFYDCKGLTNVTIGAGVADIGRYAFSGCSSLTSITFADVSKTWTVKSGSTVKASDVSVVDPAQNATYFKTTYKNYAWTKNS